MEKLRTLLIAFFFIAQGIYGQANVEITSVNFRLDNDRIIVEYSIVNRSPGERFTIDLKFVTENDQVIIPKYLSGDVGKNIEEGTKKTIIWDIIEDRFIFSGNLKAVVTAVPSMVHSGGPANALLSVAVPGLGGHFVEENKIRSIVTSIGTAGFMTYGIIEKRKSKNYYADYQSGTDVQDMVILYDKANSAHHKYFIATRIAALAWIADIAWVAYRGYRNKNEMKSGYQGSGEGLTLNCTNQELQLGYKIIF